VYAVSSTFLNTLRQSHTMYARVDAYRNGVVVYAGLPFTAGEVQVNSGTGVRRQLSLTCPRYDSAGVDLWATIAVIGTELRAYRGIRYSGIADPEVVPLGVFPVVSQSLDVANSGDLTITAPDRWSLIQRARFLTPFVSINGATVKDEITRLVTGAIPGIAVDSSAIKPTLVQATATVPTLIWDMDRDKAITDLASTIGAEVFFDWTGQAVIRPAPLLSATPVAWRVDADSAIGVMLDGQRGRSSEATCNVVMVDSTNTDGSSLLPRQVVQDNDPTSPTYVGTYGSVPYRFASPLFTSTAQMQAAGTAVLNKLKAAVATLSVTSVTNPALDRGDVFYAVFPDGVIERHMAESFPVSLTADGDQQVVTRSSRPDGTVPPSE
jgi:hypothetical protein